MKSPRINNYLFSDKALSFHGSMSELNSIKVREMMKCSELNIENLPLNLNLMQPTLYSGIQVERHEPMRERDLSTEEFLNLFDRHESLRMAYIPHFITQCVVYYLDLLVDYARDNRLSEYKKQSRKLKEIKAEYIDALRHEMPADVFQKFLAQRDEYLVSCGSNLNLMYFTFGNQILKHYGRVRHESIFCYANIIVAFIEYVEEFDRQVNKRIAEKLGMPCRNHGDARLTDIKSVCISIKNQYPVETNEQTKLCVNVMVNKATTMINAML